MKNKKLRNWIVGGCFALTIVGSCVAHRVMYSEKAMEKTIGEYCSTRENIDGCICTFFGIRAGYGKEAFVDAVKTIRSGTQEDVLNYLLNKLDTGTKRESNNYRLYVNKCEMELK